MKIKKIIISVACLLLAVMLGVGGYGVYSYLHNNNNETAPAEQLKVQIEANNNEIFDLRQEIDEKLVIIAKKQENADAETAGEIAALEQEITVLQERIEALEAENQKLENEIMKLNIVQTYGEADLIMNDIQDDQSFNPKDYRFLLFAVRNADYEWSSEIFLMSFVASEAKSHSSTKIYVNGSIDASARYYVYEIFYHNDDLLRLKLLTYKNATWACVWGVK